MCTGLGRTMRHWGRVAALVLISLGACGTDEPREGSGSPTQGGMGDHAGMGGADTSAFGEAADAHMADRTLAVSMFDAFSFEPSEIAVDQGEMIAFEVTNEGEVPHEFVLGDDAFQREHEAEMSDMGSEFPPDEPFAIGVQSGETKTLAWAFTEAGTFEFACHVPGHYLAGMVGTITVAG